MNLDHVMHPFLGYAGTFSGEAQSCSGTLLMVCRVSCPQWRIDNVDKIHIYIYILYYIFILYIIIYSIVYLYMWFLTGQRSQKTTSLRCEKTGQSKSGCKEACEGADLRMNERIAKALSWENRKAQWDSLTICDMHV
jgi:hypothetical protein